MSELSYQDAIDDTSLKLHRVIDQHTATLKVRETGTVSDVERGIARVHGLPHVQADEMLRFAGNLRGYAFNLDRDEVGCVLLDDSERLQAGTRVERTHSVLDTPVGDGLLGRIIDPIGRPLDSGRSLDALERLPCERDAPPIIQRAPVTVPLQTGLKVIDALIPIGRGQRQLILGDRQTGKTAIAVDAIVNQRCRDVICIYCSIGQRSTNVARVIDNLRRHDALQNTVVVIGANDAPPGVQFVAPYAATTIGENFMEQGRDVLIVYDDLTAHARAYRHVSLLLRRPPGREAFPGDIFYVHSRLLERATHLRTDAGGGSLTALPIIETEAQNVSAYIPTNLISITDGQVYLSPNLFRKGILPAVDVGRSVSRVGGKTQLPAYRAVAGDLRLTYSQFEELEKFARFSSQLDEDTRKTLERGKRIREILKQPQFQPLEVPEQIASLLAVTSGRFDEVDPIEIRRAELEVQDVMKKDFPELGARILEGGKLSEDDVVILTEGR
ncbi:alternate F1F0 ATPase, F1 subunit alpha [Novipirellula artificiosorum]|uniref:ATP synthase subunit alpha n=1 Tax=Novipirellula artificiosorum TaxID=2528016 RepID=A0A5C6DNC5_9BACT|nr:alternate F1F0 ATPase, F1 subunit alpha [Novipirellula artificiosorum]TWU38350.1 ATP synthase subunit alpha [Novipirellula artificiosorum]